MPISLAESQNQPHFSSKLISSGTDHHAVHITWAVEDVEVTEDHTALQQPS